MFPGKSFVNILEKKQVTRQPSLPRLHQSMFPAPKTYPLQLPQNGNSASQCNKVIVAMPQLKAGQEHSPKTILPLVGQAPLNGRPQDLPMKRFPLLQITIEPLILLPNTHPT